ncbi:MAG: molybdenum cofactor biosynthesis protein MoaE [Acidimicrobiia bacterium]
MNGEPVADGVRTHVAVSASSLDVSGAAHAVADPSAGCSVVFTGMVRDHAPGKTDVSRLEYEAYAGVVEQKIGDVISDARHRWDIIHVVALHRTGELAVGEVAVVVAVSSAHRKDAFPAAQFIIDELKSRAPIWKKEHWPGGAEWVEGA